MKSSQPNILVFLTDQQRWDTCGINGNPLGLTPNYDRLARAGTHAPLAFTPQPVCGPARSCLQSGQYPTRTGCFRNDIPLPRDIPTIAGCFNDSGYDTAYIGKWHLAPHPPIGPVDVEWRGGYQYWLAANILELVSDAYETRLYDNDNQEVTLPGYRVDALTDAAIRYIDSRQSVEKPFFLFLSFLEPHHQNSRDDYPAPTGYDELYRDRWTPPDLEALGGSTQEHLPGYCGMVKRLDEALGRIEDALRSTGQLENTLLVFTSDHGCHFKTRNDEYKRSPHESSIRIPLMLHGPGFMNGGELDRLVSLIDLPATLLTAGGITSPESMDGFPLQHPAEAGAPEEIFIQISEAMVGRALRTPRWKYAVDAPGAHPREVPGAECYEESHLYDLQNDPWELDNLVRSPDHTDIREQLRGRLLLRMKQAGEPPATVEPSLEG